MTAVNLERFSVVKPFRQAGDPVLVRDQQTGYHYVLKRGRSAEHIREEMTANHIYQTLGVPVPPFQSVDLNGRPAQLAAYIKGRPLNRFNDRAFVQLRRGFIADVLTANWDVIGSGVNIVVDRGGTPYRVDNGGSLRYRAHGQPKPSFDTDPTEFWTLRNPRWNPVAAQVFGTINAAEIDRQLTTLTERQDAVLARVTDERLHRLLSARIKRLCALKGTHDG